MLREKPVEIATWSTFFWVFFIVQVMPFLFLESAFLMFALFFHIICLSLFSLGRLGSQEERGGNWKDRQGA